MKNIDHPLIIIAQALIAVYLFRLFFSVRRSAAPVPQIIGVAAWCVLANMAGRVGGKGWFWVADISEYIAFAAVVIATFLAVDKQEKQAAKLPNAPVIILDFFDRWEIKLTWMFGLIVAGVLTYAYVDSYMGKQQSETKAYTAAKRAEAQATAEYNEQLCKNEQQQKQLLSAVTSISAAQNTIIANQQKGQAAILNSNEALKKQVKQQSKEVKKTLQNTVIQTRPIDSKPKTEQKEPNLWNRFKGIFKTSARVYPDSLIHADSDTLVYQ